MRKHAILKLINDNKSVFITLIILNMFFTFASPYYFTFYNFNNIFQHAAFTVILASGMVMVIATGGIDISVGSNMAFTGLIVATLFKAGVPIFIAVLAGLLLGVFFGAINGAIISKLRIQPLIVTLAMLSILRGATMVMSKGYPITDLPEGFLKTFSGDALIENGLYIGIGVAILAALLINKTSFGTHICGIGANADCCYVCAIDVSKVRVMTYAIQGGLAALASMVFMASVDAAEPTAGLTTEWLEAIAAPIIGGNHMDGGKASVLGTVMGALVLSTIRSGLNIIRVNRAYQQVVIGLVMIIAVTIDAIRQHKAAA